MKCLASTVQVLGTRWWLLLLLVVSTLLCLATTNHPSYDHDRYLAEQEETASLTVDDLLQLREDVQRAGMPEVSLVDLNDGIQRFSTDDNTQTENCGANDGPCGEELTCMQLGLQKHCVPLDCLQDIVTEYRTTTLTEEFWQNMLAEAGVTTEEVSQAFLERDEYRKDPYLLMGFDNPWRRFAETFQRSHPDFQRILEKSNECIAKAPTIEGVTPLFGVSWGGGAILRFDFSFLWGNGSGDVAIDRPITFIAGSISF